MGTGLALAETRVNLSARQDGESAFDFSHLRVFTSIPRYNHDIVALRGSVIVFENYLFRQEQIQEGALYVREGQHPPSNMQWDAWLQHEREQVARSPRHNPLSPLKIVREVVQAIQWPQCGNWSLRLPSGFVDGPYHDWAFGADLIGKVVGVYRPDGAGACA